jgi:hypothetical protein
MKKIIIDPPSGWQYGFPKPIPEDRLKDVRVWLVENGYPQKEIDAYGKHFVYRCWEDIPTYDGILSKEEDDCWIVSYDDKWLNLHPDDVNEIIENEKVFDNMEARIASDPNVKFEIVEHKKMSGVIQYAKLIK